MARLWRAFLPEARRADDLLALPEAEAHHVRRVLRLRHGDPLGVFDGEGHEWLAELVAEPGAPMRVRLGQAVTGAVEASLAVTLFQGACRTDRVEWIVQKATEIGVAAVLVVRTRRAERLRETPQRLERWRRIAVEACKQSGRRRVPEIGFREELPPIPAGEGPGLLLAPGPDSVPLGELLAGPSPGAVWVAVGPEAGFEDEEVTSAADGGWRSVQLGPRILRTETAGAVAASLILHRWGDLGSV